MLIINKMLIFLILMLIGLLLVKVKILDERTTRKLSTLVLYVANPALIINSSQSEQAIQGSDLLTAVLVTIIFYAVLIAVAAVLPKIMRVDRSLTSAYTMMTVFTNIGFMGIPLVSEIFGTSGLLYVSIFILIFNILIYTYGVMILQRGTNSNARKRFSLRKFINPGVISSVIAVTFYLLRIRLPEILTAPMDYLSNLTAPLGMMVIGATLANIDVRSFFTDVKLWIFSAIRLMILPILGGFALKFFLGSGELLNVCIVMLSMPVASMSVMVAQQYGGEDTLLSKGVALTTLLCIGTIPVVLAVLL